MTLRPLESAYASFFSSRSSSSRNMSRLSECPSTTQPTPRSNSCSALISPVNAPQPLKLQFCAATCTPPPIFDTTFDKCNEIGATTTSHPLVSQAAKVLSSSASTPAMVRLHFQLPPTIGLLIFD